MKNTLLTFMGSLTLLYLPATAQEGTFDTTFGTGGKQTFFFDSYQMLNDLTLQQDGKIVAVGDYWLGTPDNKFYMQRLLPNGTPDSDMTANIPGWAYPGATFFNYGAKSGANAVAIQPDGKILVAGTTSDQGGNSGNVDFLIIRYNADGTLDTGFRNQGIYTVNAPGGQSATAMAVQGDKVIISASFPQGGLTRLNPDGSTDTTFGTAGFAQNGGHISIGTDGSIYTTAISGNTAIGVRKYTADGILDTAFGNGGTQLVNFGGSDAIAFAITVTEDGNVFVTGTHKNSNAEYYKAVTIAFDAAGNVIETFGNNGIITRHSTGGACQGHGIAVQHGKVIIGYSEGLATNYDFTVAAYNMDGTPYTSFGTNGLNTFYFGSANDHDYLRALLIQPDGKILVGGRSVVGGCVARLYGVTNPNAATQSFTGNKLIVYPNPATNSIKVRLENYPGNINITLYDMPGAIVYSGVLKASENSIDVSLLPRGIYLLKAEASGKEFIQKIIIH